MGERPEEQADQPNLADRNARIVTMRDEGASWLEIQREFDLTRQQARYAYQLGKRADRRKSRRAEN